MNEENNLTIEPKLEYRGIFIRFIAHMIDAIILGILFKAVLILLSIFNIGVWYSISCVDQALMITKHLALYSIFGSTVVLFYLFFIFTHFFLYYVLLEWAFGGTLGKLATGIRVVKSNGQPLDFKASLIRNAMRVIDFLPFSYIVGIISIMCSKQKQRLGDHLADTVVVSKRQY